MKTQLIIAALLIVTTACTNGTPVVVIPTTTVPIVIVPPPPPPPEPGQQPVRINEVGLKVGRCFQPDKGNKWAPFTWHGTAPACGPEDFAGGPCKTPYASCSLNGSLTAKLDCKNTEPVTCFGWVYEKDILTGKSKPFVGANADLFHMALCMIGACKPLAGPVKTNQFGYYEMTTNIVPESTSLRAWLDGYYGTCGGANKPSCYDGRCSTGDTILNSRGSEIRPIELMKITPTSCN